MGELENGARAIRNASEKIVSLFNFAKGASRTGSVSHTGREKISKLGNVEGWGVRKITEKNGRGSREVLVRKCYEKGGGSL